MNNSRNLFKPSLVAVWQKSSSSLKSYSKDHLDKTLGCSIQWCPIVRRTRHPYTQLKCTTLTKYGNVQNTHKITHTVRNNLKWLTTTHRNANKLKYNYIHIPIHTHPVCLSTSSLFSCSAIFLLLAPTYMFIGNGHNKYCSWVRVAKKVVCIGKRGG